MSSSHQPLFSTLRFVQSNGQPSNEKKRVASRACDACRRRKKRCFHALENQAEAEVVESGQQPPARQNNASLEHVLESRPRPTSLSSQYAPSQSMSQTEASTQPRFIGDLNPAVELLSATTPTMQPKNNVGVWHNEAAEPAHAESGVDMFSPLSAFHELSEPAQTQLQSILKRQCLHVFPSRQNFEILEAFYFDNVHPLLPCVDKTLYWESPIGSPAKILQEQTVCLMTCPNLSLKDLLWLPGGQETLSPTEFSRKIVCAMRLSIEMALVQDKTIIIQALVAMSLIAYGRESLELTPQFFIRAVQHGYTIGLHQPGDAERNEKTAGLFCSVWSMDRLHAAMQGRPVIMHEVDMAKYPKTESAKQEPGFKVLIAIAILLDKVIALYRPDADAVEIPDEEFPTFEEILEQCGAMRLPAHLIATLELFYHAVAILSCRYSSGPQQESHKARNNRQASSTMQILSIMEDSDVADKLVVLPWVPYAVSLSLSTAYRDFRHCKALTHRIRARKRLVQAYKHLLPFGQVFWSAAFMAEMAGKILQERGTNDGQTAETSLQTSRRPSTVPNGLESMPENALFDTVASLDVDQPIFDVGTDWNLGDLDGILEGNLDPSIPWYHQDMPSFFNVDL